MKVPLRDRIVELLRERRGGLGTARLLAECGVPPGRRLKSVRVLERLARRGLVVAGGGDGRRIIWRAVRGRR